MQAVFCEKPRRDAIDGSPPAARVSSSLPVAREARPTRNPPPLHPSSDSLVPFAPDAAGRATWLRHLEPVELDASVGLFRQGDPADSLYFVERGELAVVLEVPGAGRVPVRRFGPGQCIGEMALYRRETRAATVEALAPSALWRLSAERLHEIELQEPALAAAMHRHVAGLLAGRVAYSNTELKEPLACLAHAIRGLAASRFGETEWDRDAVAAATRRADEVGAVAGAVDHLVGQLAAYLDELRAASARREAIESELRIAGEIQTSFLPPVLAPGLCPEMDFMARMKPAREAGGDLYDGFFLEDGRFLVVVGDVAGKGVSAALFMAVTATGIRALASGTRDPGELMTRVNRLLCERNDTLQFVTVFAALYDPKSGEFTWTNCGHPPAAVLRADGRFELLDGPRATPLAVFETNVYSAQHARLAPGDMLVAYTDGVTEAMDARDALYGDDRLHDLLTGRPMTSSGAVLDVIMADVLAHQGAAPQADDITLLALRRL